MSPGLVQLICPRCHKTHSSGRGEHPSFSITERIALLRAGQKAVLSWPSGCGHNVFIIRDDGNVLHPAYQAWKEVFGAPVDTIEAHSFFVDMFRTMNLDWLTLLDKDPASAARFLASFAYVEEATIGQEDTRA